MAEQFDVIVIGAGAMGSAAAYHLARDKQRVLLLEQFELAHTRGSSHGESRIFRFAYEQVAYARLAKQTKPLWHALEADAGESLLLDTGGLDFTDEAAHFEDITKVAAALNATGSAYEELDQAALAQRFPQWHLNEGGRGVYSPDAGALNATKCVQTMAKRAAAHGATIHDREPVGRIHAETSHVEVVTHKGDYRAARLVIAAGGWINKLLGDLGISLPLTVTQEQVVYFKPIARPESFSPERFPIWIHHRPDGAYGFPMLTVPGVKLGLHEATYAVNIDEYTATPRPATTQRLHAYLSHYLPDAAGEAFDAIACLYTNTPDRHFIIDTVPQLPHVAVASACSGHGFKFAIGVGRALADLVMHGATELVIAPFRTLKNYIR
jgi:sarcosine oxidase